MIEVFDNPRDFPPGKRTRLVGPLMRELTRDAPDGRNNYADRERASGKQNCPPILAGLRSLQGERFVRGDNEEREKTGEDDLGLLSEVRDC
ncbi:hypothetical protein KM043_015897 [Ampulex compressa]|nr:hypothetical protein KM043_015897 [Ampulex compressa]